MKPRDGTFTATEERVEEARAIVAVINGREAQGETLPDFVREAREHLRSMIATYEEMTKGDGR